MLPLWQLLVVWNLCLLVFHLSQIEMLKSTIKKFYGETKQLQNISKIVNEYHFQRLRNLLKDPRVADSVVHGGLIDEENL